MCDCACVCVYARNEPCRSLSRGSSGGGGGGRIGLLFLLNYDDDDDDNSDDNEGHCCGGDYPPSDASSPHDALEFVRGLLVAQGSLHVPSACVVQCLPSNSDQCH
jgi:hypothetical protein